MSLTDYLNPRTVTQSAAGFFGFKASGMLLNNQDHICSNLLALMLAGAGCYATGDVSNIAIAGPIAVGVREIAAQYIPPKMKIAASVAGGAVSTYVANEVINSVTTTTLPNQPTTSEIGQVVKPS